MADERLLGSRKPERLLGTSFGIPRQGGVPPAPPSLPTLPPGETPGDAAPRPTRKLVSEREALDFLGIAQPRELVSEREALDFLGIAPAKPVRLPRATRQREFENVLSEPGVGAADKALNILTGFASSIADAALAIPEALNIMVNREIRRGQELLSDPTLSPEQRRITGFLVYELKDDDEIARFIERGPDKSPLAALTENAQKLVAELFPTDPRLAGNFLYDTLPRGFGYAAGFIGAGGVARLGVGGTAKLAARRAGLKVKDPAGRKLLQVVREQEVLTKGARPASITAVIALGSASLGVEMYRDAIRHGATEEQAYRAYQHGLMIGPSEALPIARVLRRFDKATGGGMRRILKQGLMGGGEELVQEVLQQGLSNFVAKRIYDENRSLFEGLAHAGGAGGIVGWVLSVIASAAGARRVSRRLAKHARQGVDENQAKSKNLANEVRDALGHEEFERLSQEAEARQAEVWQALEDEAVGEIAETGRLPADEAVGEIAEEEGKATTSTKSYSRAWKSIIARAVGTDFSAGKPKGEIYRQQEIIQGLRKALPYPITQAESGSAYYIETPLGEIRISDHPPAPNNPAIEFLGWSDVQGGRLASVLADIESGSVYYIKTPSGKMEKRLAAGAQTTVRREGPKAAIDADREGLAHKRRLRPSEEPPVTEEEIREDAEEIEEEGIVAEPPVVEDIAVTEEDKIEAARIVKEETKVAESIVEGVEAVEFEARAKASRALAKDRSSVLTKTGEDWLRIAAFAGFDTQDILLRALRRQGRAGLRARVQGATIEKIMGEIEEEQRLADREEAQRLAEEEGLAAPEIRARWAHLLAEDLAITGEEEITKEEIERRLEIARELLDPLDSQAPKRTQARASRERRVRASSFSKSAQAKLRIAAVAGFDPQEIMERALRKGISAPIRGLAINKIMVEIQAERLAKAKQHPSITRPESAHRLGGVRVGFAAPEAGSLATIARQATKDRLGLVGQARARAAAQEKAQAVTEEPPVTEEEIREDAEEIEEEELAPPVERRADLGPPVEGGVRDRRPDRAGEPTQVGPKIVTARAEETRRGDKNKVPASLLGLLRDHQAQGVALAIEAMDTQGGFLLADGTGAGKTRQILAVAENYRAQGLRVLIVTKNEVIKPNFRKKTFSGSYADDAAAMGIELKLTKAAAKAQALVPEGGIALTTYENIRGDRLQADDRTVIIFDEAHALKNASQQGKAGAGLADKAKAVLFATATPADKPQHFHYLPRMGIMEGKTLSEFLIDLGLTQRKTRYATFWAVNPSVGTAEVKERVSGLFSRLTEQGLMVKREVDMEGVGVDFKIVPLGKEGRDLEAKVENIIDAQDVAERSKPALKRMAKRRQLEPLKVAHAVNMALEELRHGRQVILFASRVRESAVERRVGNVVVEKVGSRGTVELLREELQAHGVTDIAEIHGEADTNAAQAMGAFQSGDARVLIATIESGGTGINLDDRVGNAPRSMIILTAPWTAVDAVQAAGRVWRMTSKSFPRITFLFSDTDTDQANASLIATKISLLGATVEGGVRLLNIDPDLFSTKDLLDVAVEGTELETLAPSQAGPSPVAGVKALEGGSSVAHAPDDPNVEFEVRHRVVELSSLIVSHQDDFTVNPDFPPHLQPRERGRQASRLQVMKIARGLVPSAIILETGLIDQGSPIVNADNVVESGNGRAIGLRLAAPEVYAGYKAALIDNAEALGLDATAIERDFKQPVVVRLRLDDTSSVDFVRIANRSAVAAMGLVEQARIDSDLVDTALLSELDPSPTQSIEQVLKGREARSLVDDFFYKIPANERPAMFDETGRVSQAGIERIRNALFARVYEGESGDSLLAAFVEFTDDAGRNLKGAMMDSTPSMAAAKALVAEGVRDPALLVTDDIARAGEVILSLRSQGVAVSDHLNQPDLFGEVPELMQRLLVHFAEHSRSRPKLREFLTLYAQEVIDSPDVRQEAMFGEEEGLTGADLISAAIDHQDALSQGKRQRENDEELFGGETADETPGRSPELSKLDDAIRTGHMLTPGRRPDEKGSVTIDVGTATDEREVPGGVYVSPDEEVARRTRLARGGLNAFKPGVASRVSAVLREEARKWARNLEHLPPTPEFADARMALQNLFKQPVVQAESSRRIVTQFFAPLLSDAHATTFADKIFLDDLIREVEEGRPVGFGYEGKTAQLRADHGEVTARAEAVPQIREALARRQALWGDLRERYTAALAQIGIKPPDSFSSNPFYVHHQVLSKAIIDKWGEDASTIAKSIKGTRGKLQAPEHRTFLRGRKGTTLDWNRNLAEVEEGIIAQMLYDIEIAKTLKLLDDRYNSFDKLKARARKLNIENAAKMWAAVAKATGMTAVEAMNKQLGKKMAIGLSRMGHLAAKGELPDGGGQWTELIDAMATDHAARRRARRGKPEILENLLSDEQKLEVFGYAGWLLKQHAGDVGSGPAVPVYGAVGEQAKIAALTIFKGRAEKQKAMRAALEQDGGKWLTWRDLVPEGYEVFDQHSGKPFHWAMSIPMRLAQAQMEGNLSGMLEIPIEKLRKQLVVGARPRMFVIPAPLARQLEGIRPGERLTGFPAVLAKARAQWGAWTLINPLRFFPYRMRNFSGDLEAALWNPQHVKFLTQAYAELFDAFWTKKAITPILEEFRIRGGFNSSQVSHETANFSDQKVLRNLLTDLERTDPKRLLSRLRQLVVPRELNEFLEAILRYANFLSYNEQIQRGKGRPDNYGASLREEIDALSDPVDKAYKLSNELVGSYDQVSVRGQQLRASLMRFYSWKEVNLKRFKRLAQNAYLDTNDSETVAKFAAWLGIRATTATLGSMRLLWRLLKTYGALFAVTNTFNLLFFRDEEEELPETVRGRMHIIYGRNKDGSVAVYTRLGAFEDLLEDFGFEAVPGFMRDVLNGHLGLQEAFSRAAKMPAEIWSIPVETGKALLNTSVQLLDPWVKAPAELLMDRTTYPDAFNPRKMPSHGEYFWGWLGLSREYAEQRSLVTNQPSRPNSTWMNRMFYTNVDVGNGAYNDLNSHARQWWTDKHGGKPSGGVRGTTDKDEALLWHWLARKWGDKEKAKYWENKYRAYGGSEQGVKTSRKRKEPLGWMQNQAQRSEYIKSIRGTVWEKKLERARAWYDKIWPAGGVLPKVTRSVRTPRDKRKTTLPGLVE